MLFGEKSEADNFIKYNHGGILEENGKAPVRSYYCELCCGYHVTSNPSKEEGEKKWIGNPPYERKVIST